MIPPLPFTLPESLRKQSVTSSVDRHRAQPGNISTEFYFQSVMVPEPSAGRLLRGACAFGTCIPRLQQRSAD